MPDVRVTRTVEGELVISVTVAVASIAPNGAFDRTQLDAFTVNSIEEVIKRLNSLKLEKIPVPF